jgi:Lectin C-type domain
VKVFVGQKSNKFSTIKIAANDFNVFWTAAYAKRSRHFSWLSANASDVHAELWAQNQPDTEQDDSNCVAVSFVQMDAPLGGLQNLPCATEIPVICQ